METAEQTTQIDPTPNPNAPTVVPKKPFPVQKLLYGVIFALILIILGGILAYFVFLKPKPQETAKVATNSATVSAAPEKPVENFEVVYVTAAEGLNLREEANTNSLVITLLPKNTELKVISNEGDWYFVEAQTRGFVHKDFVSRDKPTDYTLKTYQNSSVPFTFLYPSVYKIEMKTVDKTQEFNFTGNESFGGFKVTPVEGSFATMGNYALKNYPQATKASCEPIRFGTQTKECDKVTDETGTTFLVLVNTTLYKIGYLKTEGGLLTDLNNLVFYSLHFGE